MACMAHGCLTPGCYYEEFNNRLGPLVDACPKCGGTEFSRTFDEAPEYDRDDDDDDDDD